MAARREAKKRYPRDALVIYQRRVDQTLRHADARACAAAVQILKRVKDVMSRMGTDREFADYLESVRTAHARKRNFIRLLARANWDGRQTRRAAPTREAP